MRGGQPDVAGQGQLRGARARGAVEGGDDDLGQGLDGVVEPVGGADQLEDLFLGIAGPHRRAQDAHGEELGAGAGDDHGLDPFVPAEIIHDALERQEDVAGEPVLVTGAIEGQGEDALGALLVDLG
jgi:hypothetical protein